MYAVIGLGNPGAKYAETRHNMGFWAVEALASDLGLSGWQEKSGCRFVRGDLGEEELLLIEPLKFMNCSGEAVQPIISFYKIPPKSIIVLYDELDLDPGTIRLKKGGAESSSHGGIDDLITHLGSPDFYRVRIGIGHPRRSTPDIPIAVADYVLGRPRGEDVDKLRDACRRAAKAVPVLIREGLEAAQRAFHVSG